MQKHKIELHPTKYPIKVNWEFVESQCKAYGIPLVFFNDARVEKTSFKTILEPKGNLDIFNAFTNCHQVGNCTHFGNGKLYPCNIVPNIHYFNSAFNQNLPITPLDSIDIYKAKDYNEILQFLAKPIPFCRFCNLAKWKSIGEWKTSKRTFRSIWSFKARFWIMDCFISLRFTFRKEKLVCVLARIPVSPPLEASRSYPAIPKLYVV